MRSHGPGPRSHDDIHGDLSLPPMLNVGRTGRSCSLDYGMFCSTFLVNLSTFSSTFAPFNFSVRVRPLQVLLGHSRKELGLVSPYGSSASIKHTLLGGKLCVPYLHDMLVLLYPVLHYKGHT